MISELHDSFLQLVRLGIGTSKGVSVPKDLDWPQLKKLADNQGLSAVLLDGIDKLPADNRPSQFILLEWIGEVLQNYEQRYVAYEKAIGSLAGFYNRHGLKVMVLKGYACSIEWPKPEHRPCGDIDIWLFGKQKEADATLEASLKTHDSGFKIDNSHHHHTVFEWRGFTVENHYDFVNIHYNQSNFEIEKEFKKLGCDDSYNIEVFGEKVYMPSPNLHALFLLRHAMVEFASSGITLRNIVDWAFFVKSHGREVDWRWLENMLERFGMKKMYNIFNSICIEELGFDANMFPNNLVSQGLKEKVLRELLNPSISNKKPQGLLHRIIWKYNRWRANEWKRLLVYKESSKSVFFRGVWHHLLKPRTI